MRNPISSSLAMLFVLSLAACGGSSGGGDAGGGGGSATGVTLATSTGTSITAGATGIPTHAPLTATFAESMGTSSVENGYFIVEGAKGSPGDGAYDSTTCDSRHALEAGIECSGDGSSTTSCTLNPRAFLSGETTYTLCITSGVQKMDGSSLEGAAVSFTTASAIANHDSCGDASAQVFAVIAGLPFDIAESRRISKFRSCVGHSFNDSFEATPYSSMKHYVYGPAAHVNCYEVKVYAPFDGTVVAALTDSAVDFPDNIAAGCSSETHEAHIGIRSRDYPRFALGYEHVNPKPGLGVGNTVTAGEEIGYAILPTPENGSWDLLFGTLNISGGTIATDAGVIFFSYCDIGEYLSAAAATTLARGGINDLGVLKYTKAEREAEECTGTIDGNSGQMNFTGPRLNWDEWFVHFSN